MRKRATPLPIPSTLRRRVHDNECTMMSLSGTLRRSVLGIGSGVARFLMIAEYATHRYLRCVVNVMLLLSQLSVSFVNNTLRIATRNATQVTKPTTLNL